MSKKILSGKASPASISNKNIPFEEYYAAILFRCRRPPLSFEKPRLGGLSCAKSMKTKHDKGESPADDWPQASNRIIRKFHWIARPFEQRRAPIELSFAVGATTMRLGQTWNTSDTGVRELGDEVKRAARTHTILKPIDLPAAGPPIKFLPPSTPARAKKREG